MPTVDLKTTAQERAQLAQAVAVVLAALAKGGRKDMIAKSKDGLAADPICVMLRNLGRQLWEAFGGRL